MSDLIPDPNAYFRCEKGCGVFPRKDATAHNNETGHRLGECPAPACVRCGHSEALHRVGGCQSKVTWSGAASGVGPCTCQEFGAYRGSSAEPAPPTSDARKLSLIEFALKAHRFVEAEDFDDGNAAGEIAAHCSCGFICSPEGNEWVKDHRIAWERHVAAAILAAKPSYSVVMDAEKPSLSPVQEEAPMEKPNAFAEMVASMPDANTTPLPGLHHAIDDKERHRCQKCGQMGMLSPTVVLDLKAEVKEANALLDAAIADWDKAAKAVARLTTETTEAKTDRDKFRDWFQNAEQARAVAEANVERLTREKAAVEDKRDWFQLIAFSLVCEHNPDKILSEIRVEAKAWLDKQLRASREQAIQDIEALPFHDMNADGDEIDPLIPRSAVLLILGEAPTNG